MRAGIVRAPGDYPWSSYRINGLGLADPLVTPHERYHALGVDDRSRRAAYRALCDAPFDEPTLRDVREATHKGWALGDDHFRERIATLLTRRVGPLPKGAARW